MAIAEVTPSGATMGRTNYALSASVASATTSASLYPKENIINPQRTKRWRSTSSTADQKVVIDLGGAYSPTMLALVDCNVKSGQTVTVKMSTTSAMASPETLSLTTYAQTTPGGVLVWYFSGWTSSRQFLEVTLPANGTDDAYYEVGAIYVGTYDTFSIDKGLRIQATDPSVRSESYSGNVYVDAQTAYHTISFDVTLLTYAQAYAFKSQFASATTTHTVLDLHAFNRDVSGAAVITPASTFYGFPASGGGFSMQVVSPTENAISVSFEEARI